MKIRIKGNSLRYRLTKTDVNIFATEGYIEETTNIGGRRFAYALQRSFAGQLSAMLEDNKITMLMPQTLIDEWSATNRIGFENMEENLFLLVEKDFVCLDNVLEDQSDNYPNPNMVKC